MGRGKEGEGGGEEGKKEEWNEGRMEGRKVYLHAGSSLFKDFLLIIMGRG